MMTAFPRLRALDGLRGLAVLAVVVYHFRPSWLPAGFLGVDLFFVLSGFLITSLLLIEGATTGRIAIGAFWGRRLRRLLPALLLLLGVLAASSPWLLASSARSKLRGEAFGTLAYIANWRAIANDDSYANRFGDPSVLRHAWSLAIEEQFYVVWPLVVSALVVWTARRGREPSRALLALCAVAASASGIAMWQLHDPLRDPSRVYYGTDTRAQAVLVGAGLAALVRGAPRLHAPAWRVIAKVAAVLLLPALFVANRQLSFTDDRLYRGGFLLYAIAASVVVLGAVQEGRNPVRRVLEWRPLVVLGVVSYGVYLWHWPVLLLVDQDRTGLDGVALLAVQVATTAALTAASWYLVETPLRRARIPRRIVALGAPAAIALVVVVVFAATVVNPSGSAIASSLVDVPPTAVPLAATVPTDPVDATPAVSVAPAPTGPVKVLLVGDSVAWSIGGGRVDFPQPDTYQSPFDPNQVLLWNAGRYACELLPGNSRVEGDERAPSGTCPHWETDWAQKVDQLQPELVVFTPTLWDTYDHKIDGEWVEFGTAAYDEQWTSVVERLRELATRRGATLVLLSLPLADNDQEPNTQRDQAWRMEHLNTLSFRFAAAHRDVTYVDVAAFVCPFDDCPDPEALRYDGLHYDEEGARVLAQWLTPQFEQIARG